MCVVRSFEPEGRCQTRSWSLHDRAICFELLDSVSSSSHFSRFFCVAAQVFSVTGGFLPSGVQLDAETGAIWGTPSSFEPFRDVTVTARNAFGAAQTVVKIGAVGVVRRPCRCVLHARQYAS